ncbi:MAG: DUF4249 family protein [bacterium]
MSFKTNISGLLFLSPLLLSACGEGTLSMDNTFQPRIVIQGYLFPNHKVEVRLLRNFPLNATIDDNEVILSEAQAVIIDQEGSRFELRFDADRQIYESSAIAVDYGKRYTLEVHATIDAKALFARSTTTVPQPGFEILEENSVLDSLVYRQRDENGQLIDFEIVFNRSPGTDFYALALNALDADTSTFIYDNPFDDFDVDDVLEDFEDFKYTYGWIQDTPLQPGESSIDVFSFFTWFYGEYEAVVLAGDRNFRDFLISHGQVQEIDGNFHEPAFHIEGDGIGVFGSAIADTAYFTVLRQQ